MDPARRHRRVQHAGITFAGLLATVSLLAVVAFGLAPSGAAIVDGFCGTHSQPAVLASSGDELDALIACVQLAADVQFGDAERLDIMDAAGQVTSVFLADGVLRVARPGGSVDDVLRGVKGVTFDVHRSRTLEDSEPLVEHGIVWTTGNPRGTSQAVILEAGQQLALGFTLQSDVPDALDMVDEVNEELVGAILGELFLRAGRIDAHGREFCHLRDEVPHDGSHAAGPGVLTLELFEARAPGDARPTGKSLANLSLPMSRLPHAVYNWFDLSLGEEVLPPEVLAPGARVNKRWWTRRPEVVLNVTPTPEQVVIDLTEWQSAILPGKAYTLLLGATGDDLLVIEAVGEETAEGSEVALKSNSEWIWEKQPLTVWRELQGQKSFSQTTEVHVPRRVDLHLDLEGELSRDVEILIEPLRTSSGTAVPRRSHVALEGAGRVPAIDQSLARLLEGASDFPVTRFSGRTLLQGAELRGLVILEQDSVLYLDDVVLRGSIVSGQVSEGGNAPRIVIDGAVRISSTEVLPGTAIYLPGGEIRTAAGITTPVQIEGDVIAHALVLDTHGAIHGQVASVGEPQLGKAMEQPFIRRARQLRPPGLER